MYLCNIDFPGGSVVKNLPAKQEMQVRSLGQEDALEMEMATHSSILAEIILWTEEPGGLQSMGLQRIGQDRVMERLSPCCSHTPTPPGLTFQLQVCTLTFF